MIKLLDVTDDKKVLHLQIFDHNFLVHREKTGQPRETVTFPVSEVWDMMKEYLENLDDLSDHPGLERRSIEAMTARLAGEAWAEQEMQEFIKRGDKNEH